MPELEGALKSLDSLNKNDIGEIRGYTNAPKAVEKTMAAVLTILKEPKQDWDHAKSVLGDPNFLRRAGPPRQRWGQTPFGGRAIGFWGLCLSGATQARDLGLFPRHQWVASGAVCEIMTRTTSPLSLFSTGISFVTVSKLLTAFQALLSPTHLYTKPGSAFQGFQNAFQGFLLLTLYIDPQTKACPRSCRNS